MQRNNTNATSRKASLAWSLAMVGLHGFLAMCVMGLLLLAGPSYTEHFVERDGPHKAPLFLIDVLTLSRFVVAHQAWVWTGIVLGLFADGAFYWYLTRSGERVLCRLWAFVIALLLVAVGGMSLWSMLSAKSMLTENPYARERAEETGDNP